MDNQLYLVLDNKVHPHIVEETKKGEYQRGLVPYIAIPFDDKTYLYALGLVLTDKDFLSDDCPTLELLLNRNITESKTDGFKIISEYDYEKEDFHLDFLFYVDNKISLAKPEAKLVFDGKYGDITEILDNHSHLLKVNSSDLDEFRAHYQNFFLKNNLQMLYEK